MRCCKTADASLGQMVEHDLSGTLAACIEPRHESRHVSNKIKSQRRRLLAFAADDERYCIGGSFAQHHRAPIQPVQMLRLAACSIADLRFARFLQLESAAMRDHTALPIRKL